MGNLGDRFTYKEHSTATSTFQMQLVENLTRGRQFLYFYGFFQRENPVRSSTIEEAGTVLVFGCHTRVCLRVVFTVVEITTEENCTSRILYQEGGIMWVSCTITHTDMHSCGSTDGW